MFEIGNSLREARARRKLSYDQVEAETKIRAKYIRCLEDEEFDTLPSGTYVKGFLRTYADYLGLDGQLYVDEYNSRFADSHHEDQLFRRRERPAPRRRQANSTVMVALAGIVAVAVLFFVAWKFGSGQPDTAVSNAPIRLPTFTVGDTRNPAAPKTPATTHRRTHRKPKPITVRLVIYATGGDSWLKLRHGANGQLIAQRTVTDGTFLGPTKWPAGFILYDVPNPSFLRLKVNGQNYSLTGTGPWRITTSGVHQAGA